MMSIVLKKQLPWYLCLVFILSINAIQSFYTELHPDEAYYWMYAQFIDWGYFDHPPMVALFIKVGSLLGHNEFFLRLCTVISSVLVFATMWRLTKKITPNIKLSQFLLLYLNFSLFQVYGFITTPDTPLLLGTVYFFYFLYHYISKDSWKNVLLISLALLFMLYSKYHAVLIVLFTLIAYPSIFRRKSFYIILLICTIGYLPHIWWQYSHDFPTVHFHLFDRNNDSSYQYWYTSNYILAQLLFGGSFLCIWVYASVLNIKKKTQFERILFINFWGIILFFLVSSFRGKIEAHWSLLAYVPLLILSCKYLTEKQTLTQTPFKITAYIGIGIIFIARSFLIFDYPILKNSPAVQMFHHNKDWALTVHQRLGNRFCLIDNGFQQVSYYNYYNNHILANSYNSKFYRKTQYDFWDIASSFSKQYPIYVSDDKNHLKASDSIATSKGIYYYTTLANTDVFDQLSISIVKIPTLWKVERNYILNVIVKNPYHKDIILDKNQKLEFNIHNHLGFWETVPIEIQKQRIKAQITHHQTWTIRLPSNIPAGNYSSFISLKNNNLEGTRNSSYYQITIQ